MRSLDDGLVSSNDKIFIISSLQDKPIKIVFEEQPCPIAFQLGQTFRCEKAKWKMREDYKFSLCCSDVKNCEHVFEVK